MGSMKALLRSEDGWAVLIGLGLVALGGLALAGVDTFGWVVKTNEWIDAGKAMTPASAAYSLLGGPVCLLLTYLFLLVVLLVGASFLGLDLRRFALGFTVLFAISYLCWLMGHNAWIAATPEQAKGVRHLRVAGPDRARPGSSSPCWPAW